MLTGFANGGRASSARRTKSRSSSRYGPAGERVGAAMSRDCAGRSIARSRRRSQHVLVVAAAFTGAGTAAIRRRGRSDGRSARRGAADPNTTLCSMIGTSIAGRGLRGRTRFRDVLGFDEAQSDDGFVGFVVIEGADQPPWPSGTLRLAVHAQSCHAGRTSGLTRRSCPPPKSMRPENPWKINRKAGALWRSLRLCANPSFSGGDRPRRAFARSLGSV